MKTILCFGDSNTWGYDAKTKSRHPRNIRWTGKLQEKLEGFAHVIEEGLNGRTTMFDEPIRDGRNASKYLGILIESHSPLDLIIISLGANDLKPIYNSSGYYSALGIKKLIKIIRETANGSINPEILIITPTLFSHFDQFTKERFSGGKEKFSLLIYEYERIAKEEEVHFLDSNKYIVNSGVSLPELR